MKDWLLRDWCFGDVRRAYERARVNEARARADIEHPGSLTDRALAALGGADAFRLGRLRDGTPVEIASQEIGRHGMVWGASGAGKSYGLHIVMRGWAASTNRLTVVDPKGESVELEALVAAANYLALPQAAREAYAARFAVQDVTSTHITPSDLWSLPDGMAPSLLATLRSAAVAVVSAHNFSDLMAYGLHLLFLVIIHLGWGLTVRIARAFFTDEAFRTRLLRDLRDARLRDSVAHLDDTLPEQTRKAVVRQIDLLLSSAPARISFGLSPTMTRELLPTNRREAQIFLGNFGASPQRPPSLAKTMATNRLIDVLTAAQVRNAALPELLVLEEVGILIKQPAVADYLLEASRTLRWKGLAIVCVAQDPANAIPHEVANALVLNAKWLLAFECGRDEAGWLLPHMHPGTASEAEFRRSFTARIAKLATQHAVFVRKGLPGFELRLEDVPNPMLHHRREELWEVFTREIALRSMISIRAADEVIARFETKTLETGETPKENLQATPESPKPMNTPTIDDFLAALRGTREKADE